MAGSVLRQELSDYLHTLFCLQDFEDYGPNGLQIEGAHTVAKVAFAVSATQESVAQACRLGADTLIVHHGVFWKFHGVRTLTGPFAQRIIPLVQKNINLYGLHLPLDAHMQLGNAASLARLLQMHSLLPFGDYKGCPTGVQGKLSLSCSVLALQKQLQQVLQHPVLLSSYDSASIIHTVGIITGGANSDWVLAKQAGLDAYITGEMREHDYHEAKEGGMHMLAGGHHATEQFGIMSLMEHLRQKFALDCFYISSDNPA